MFSLHDLGSTLYSVAETVGIGETAPTHHTKRSGERSGKRSGEWIFNIFLCNIYSMNLNLGSEHNLAHFSNMLPIVVISYMEHLHYT